MNENGVYPKSYMPRCKCTHYLDAAQHKLIKLFLKVNYLVNKVNSSGFQVIFQFAR